MQLEQDRYGLDNGIDDAEEAAEEARDEYIEDHAPAAAKKIIASPDFSLDVLTGLGDEAKDCVLQNVGALFEAVENTDDEGRLAAAAVKLWRSLRPYIEPAALEMAKEEVADKYDADLRDLPRSHAEAARMAA